MIKKSLPFIAIGSFIIIWTIISFLFPPIEMVGWLGLHNGYVIVAIAGLLGGLSTFAPFPYYLLVLTFAGAGLNPILLGVCAGLGVVVGDSTSYLLGYHGKAIAPQRFIQKIQQFYTKIAQKYPRLMPVLFFSYGAFVPLPNDVVMIPFGLMHYPYWRIIIPFALGNISFNIVIATIGVAMLT